MVGCSSLSSSSELPVKPPPGAAASRRAPPSLARVRPQPQIAKPPALIATCALGSDLDGPNPCPAPDQQSRRCYLASRRRQPSDPQSTTQISPFPESTSHVTVNRSAVLQTSPCSFEYHRFVLPPIRIFTYRSLFL
jgi:hypothetical protein